MPSVFFSIHWDSSEDESTVPASSAAHASSSSTSGPSAFVKRDDTRRRKRPKGQVKSKKQRKIDEMYSVSNSFRAALQAPEISWIHVTDQLTELSNATDGAIKANNILETPRVFVRAISELEDAYNLSKANPSKLTKDEKKAHNKLKQEIKKLTKKHKALITQFRADQDSFMANDQWQQSEVELVSDEESAEEEEEQEYELTKSGRRKLGAAYFLKANTASADSDSDSDSDWNPDDWSSDDEEPVAIHEVDPQPSDTTTSSRAARFLKDAPSSDDDEPTDATKKEPAQPSKKPVSEPAAPTATAVAKVAIDKLAALKDPKINWTPMKIAEAYKELLSRRGARNTDSADQLDFLTVLLTKTTDPGQRVQLLVTKISLHFELISAQTQAGAPVDSTLWRNCHAATYELIDLYYSTPALADVDNDPLVAIKKLEEHIDELKAQENPGLAATTVAATTSASSRIPGVSDSTLLLNDTLVSVVSQLRDILVYSLQRIEAQTTEFVTQLEDESLFLQLAKRVQFFYTQLNATRTDNPEVSFYESAARVASLRVEHLYYKRDDHHAATSASSGDLDLATDTTNDESKDLGQLLHSLAVLVYKYGTERQKSRCMLGQIFHHALHNRFYIARDYLLMSHLQDNIQSSDIETKVLFNRTVAQMGLCAFRLGLIRDAHSLLSDLCSSGHIKQLLAQGLTRVTAEDYDPELHRQERARQVPYHMHINLNLLEACHLISAMILEVPNMARTAGQSRPRMISKNFRKLLQYNIQSSFDGPPENNRDHCLVAARHLAAGRWRKANQLIMDGLEIWSLIPDEDAVKAMVHQHIKEAALCTYLYSYADVYSSMSLQSLADMFELEPSKAYSLISKMLIEDELQASWEQPTECIIMEKVEASRLQLLALQLSDKVYTLVENNEKLFDARTGVYGYKESGKGGSSYDGARSYRRQPRGKRTRNKRTPLAFRSFNRDEESGSRFFTGTTTPKRRRSKRSSNTTAASSAPSTSARTGRGGTRGRGRGRGRGR